MQPLESPQNGQILAVGGSLADSRRDCRHYQDSRIAAKASNLSVGGLLVGGGYVGIGWRVNTLRTYQKSLWRDAGVVWWDVGDKKRT